MRRLAGDGRAAGDVSLSAEFVTRRRHVLGEAGVAMVVVVLIVVVVVVALLRTSDFRQRVKPSVWPRFVCKLSYSSSSLLCSSSSFSSSSFYSSSSSSSFFYSSSFSN
ncbi:hypothetical protein E2C01_093960 [Portunus trituberculatus]|uniref:Uncharacterized protein n=1 Tax=Portunus trituberculatus TaxID=210409 RepID=A0A5B7JW96_PORTR|nr:hypothetical protein [Portunus trituberculatus]